MGNDKTVDNFRIVWVITYSLSYGNIIENKI